MTDFGGSDELRDEPSIERVADLYSWAYAWRSQDGDDDTDLSALRKRNRAEFERALEVEIARRVAEAKAEALNEVADFLDVRGVLWHGDSGVTVMGQPYSGQFGVRLTDWLRAQAVASEGNVSEILTRSEQETL